MRYHRLIFFSLILFFSACKTVKTTTVTSNYYEDLSVHREVSNAELATEAVKEKPAHQQTRVEKYAPIEGHLKSELDSISQLVIEQNKRGKKKNGYSILVYSGTDRDQANDSKYKAQSLYPNLRPKIMYKQPTFRVQMGKFSDRLHAHKIHSLVKQDFPRAILIPTRVVIQYD